MIALPLRHRLPLAALGAVVVLGLTACGSSSDSTTSSGASPSGAQDFAAYRECLATNGVTLPSGGPGGGVRPSGAPSGMPDGGFPSGMPSDGVRPTGGPSGMPGGPGGPLPDGVDADTFAAAQKACASLAPSFGARPGGGAAGDATALVAYRACLKDHDVTLAAGADPSTLDDSDATVAAALATCAPLAPSSAATPTPDAT